MTVTIPGNLIAPLIAFDVTSAGQFEQIAPAILLGHKTDAGEATANTVVAVTTRQEARRLFGKGSMLEQMVAVLRRNAPTHPVYAVAVPATGTAEIRTITVDDVPAAGGAGVISIMGETVSVSIAAGATVNAVAAALGAAINAHDNPQTGLVLPYTATVSTDTVTLTARHAGVFSAEIDIDVPLVDGGNAFTGNLTLATGTAGAGVPDLSTAMAAIEERDWSFLLSPFPDATNLGRVATLLAARWAYDNQRFGHAFYPIRDSQSNLIAHGDAKDDWHLTPIPTFNAGGFSQPGYLWLVAQVGRVMPWLASGTNGDVSRNQTGLVCAGLAAPRDAVYWPDLATRNAFLASGLSTWAVNTAGDVAIDNMVTTIMTLNGAPDTTFRDVQAPFQIMYALRYVKARLAAEHSNKALSDENPRALAAISTLKDIEATVVHSYRELVASGVAESFTAILNQIAVARDAGNPNRVNITLPIDRTNPLDIFAGLARVYAQAA